MKFCIVVEFHDVVIHAYYGDDRSGFLGRAGIKFITFQLTCVVVLKTL